ncbi:TPA: hypothetical protein UN036_003854 [Stenotrophomonas maltophilia]|uniref:hypothetical protein n=1 Tax=Stenotrophomonas maltophilia TaxID=40324 RepID=UPI002987A59E|nr:hypothetical protein [Stenotrophomonas maltophilia]HDS1131776.1 hypothetical protein [Stenotrophomonas maltophilia]HDS1159003.1 hypothetical protein [Stenotrophomonas maltophilia]HDS1168259.1 hypothetical protein [Stenotrophomonas maltophilia]HDS1172994.1 hypothetical protein [Stenotrophomonas maltophilia]HDS1177734.1 hypothetical protein [Stenotrophomonas maltophilia]
MSYSEYQRGVQDERFSNQLEMRRVARDRDQWIGYARRQEARVRELQGKLAASVSREQQHQALAKTMSCRIEALERALLVQSHAAADNASLTRKIVALEAEVEHQVENCHWLQSVIEDHAIGLRACA